MSHTNSTTNYNLPQFLTSDKPAWLTDVNNAYSDIDSAIYAAQSKADTAYSDAGNAQSDATTAINNAAAADAKGSGAIASIESAFDATTIYPVGAKVMYNSLLYRCIVAVVTPGPWTGSDNWERITVDSLISTTDSKVGSLSSLSTTDKTSIVNAINEVNGKTGTVTNVNVSKGSAVNNATIACYQVGKLVQFYLVGDANSAFTGSSEIATGLPIPHDTNIRYEIHKTSAGTPYGIGTTYQCGIDSNGKLTPMYIPNGAIANGDYFVISFTYIARDFQ